MSTITVADYSNTPAGQLNTNTQHDKLKDIAVVCAIALVVIAGVGSAICLLVGVFADIWPLFIVGLVGLGLMGAFILLCELHDAIIEATKKPQ